MITQIISLFFTVLYILLFARVILSWVRPDPYSQFYEVYRFIFNITEPLLAPIRRILPPTGGIDFSPIILFLLISFIQRMLVSAF
ncbi:MAG: YggT family protein [Anaerolineales bacterium]|nr:YggT family protein [Anaerolineales bacterium]